MTAIVEAEGVTRRAPAALTGPGDASASRDLVGIWRGFSRACWLGLQTGSHESGDVLLAPSLQQTAAHGRDGIDIEPARSSLDLHQTDYFCHSVPVLFGLCNFLGAVCLRI